MSSILDAPCTAADFVEQLRAIGKEHYHDKHPFHLRMHRGELSRNELQRWILNRFYYQKNIPVKDAIILSKLSNREDRRRWIHRIIEHDGSREREGGIEHWLRLGQAAGLSRDELIDDSSILPAVRFAVDAYVNFCRQKSVYEAVAASLTELFAGDLIAKRIKVFELHYPWIEPEALAYFRERLRQAPREAEFALDFVIGNAQTRADREKARQALIFKCELLWSLLDAVEHADCR